MYIYKIGYHSCEDSCYVELQHESKFTKEELIKIIAEVVWEEYLKLTPGEIPEICFDSFFYAFGNKSLAELLVKNCGFKAIEYTQVLSLFGWAKIMDRTHWEHDRGEELNLLTDCLEQKQNDANKNI